MKFYKLLDPKHKNMIIKVDGPKEYEFDNSKGWVRTGRMIDYLWPESDLYDRYEEITESESLKHIGGIS